ncbi:unnamed protein product [Brassica oleracea var. botrytis]|uniref:RING-type E3 ubiquitin transferase n=2 Tax=Brassica TaxID=3705 RepID=A0A816QGC6_BRANA|nr:PREDICTED: RING-H2 finger protein ATL5-like [Brassica oleracea var. oleracea]XP_048616270.1 RING-H2 finger protein ATL5-like [Brassica napus]CAF2060094.1 unnamed protein product [Brassica napus]
MGIFDDSSSKTLCGSMTLGSSRYALNGKIMRASVIILFVAVILILCFHSYARWLFRRQNRRIRRRISAHLRSLSAARDPTQSSSHSPLDPAVLEKIPIFVYSVKTHKSPPEECSVCLSEFEEEDEGRVLPKCGHVFHVDCIDTWFRSRSSCPLCRAPVQPEQSVTESGSMNSEPVAPVFPSVKPIEDTEAGSSSSSDESDSSTPSSSSGSPLRFPMEACEREPIDLVGILVEIPREVDASNSGLPGHNGSSNRVSMKRLWSIL